MTIQSEQILENNLIAQYTITIKDRQAITQGRLYE